jgi:hypothetical protein
LRFGKENTVPGRPIKRWPNYALDSLEATLFELQEIERAARAVQLAIAEGDEAGALLLLSDVRVASRRCVEHLLRARSGNYDKSKSTDLDNLETTSLCLPTASVSPDPPETLHPAIGRG